MGEDEEAYHDPLVRTGRGMFFEDGIARRGGRYCVVGEQVTL